MFRKLLPKLLRSYALDAVETEGEAPARPDKAAVAHFIDRVASGRTDVHPGAGKGEDVRVSGEMLTAGALVNEDRLLHLAAFQIDR